MFCTACGIDLPTDSQLCRKCGKPHRVSTGSGTAAALAPIPAQVVPYARPKERRSPGLLLVAKAALVIWLVRDCIVYFPHNVVEVGGLVGAVVFDLRIWVLVIGIVLLQVRSAKQARTSGGIERQASGQ